MNKHEKNHSKKYRYLALGGIVVVLVGLFVWYKATPGPYDNLANCLKDQGALFYGAFWCPACQQQKQLFSKSANLLPYQECSTPDGKGTLPVCIEAEITTYPTWVFTDGTKLQGVQQPGRLAELASCSLN